MSQDFYDIAIERFMQWLDDAHAHERIDEPTAMTLATADAAGRPSARTVLLKHIDREGFVFYTNSHSRKGQQLQANAQAALTFFWAPLSRQILVEGGVQPVSDEQADRYFATRPRLSQIGAWASQQSEPLADRAAFDAQIETIEARFGDDPIPRPPHWTGYRLAPDMVEFWHGRDGRLHDRERYYREATGEWVWTLLNP